MTQEVPAPSGSFDSISIGNDHACAVYSKGGLSCWGNGNGYVAPSADRSIITPSTLSRAFSKKQFVDVAVSNLGVCAIDTTGQLECHGRYVSTDPARTYSDPEVEGTFADSPVPEGTFTEVESYFGQFCGIRPSGHIVCWGPYPAETVLPRHSIAKLEGDECAISVEFAVLCWNTLYTYDLTGHHGSAWRVLGGSDPQSYQRTGAYIPPGMYRAVTSDSSEGVCAIALDSTLSCWGPLDPILVPPSGSFVDVAISGAANEIHACAIRIDGTLVCWGQDLYGQADAPSGTFSAVVASANRSCALRTGGSVVCWGEGLDEASAPTESFASIALGQPIACGLLTDSSLKCWDVRNVDRELESPGGSFLNVDVKFQHACGVRSSGSVVCWSYMNDGALLHLAEMEGTFVDVNWRGQALTSSGAVVPIVFFDEVPPEYKMSWHLPSIVYRTLGPWIQQWGS